MELTNIPPIYVYTQDTTPSDLTEGKIWIDTTTSPPTTKVSDGTTYNTLSTDLSSIQKLIGLNGLNILDLTAQGSLTAGVNANFERDIYSDATGYLNTIDTGNTTGAFNTNCYKNDVEGADVVKSFTTAGDTTNQTVTAKTGFAFTANKAVKVKAVTKLSECTATHAYIMDNAGTGTLATATFTGDVATFDYQLTASTGYQVVADKEGATYTERYGASVSYPVETTNINYTAYVGAGQGANIESISVVNIVSANVIVQTNEQTIASGYSYFMIVAHETVVGNGSIDYDVSFDGGSNEQTGLNSFTEYSITDSGTGLILKQNLNGNGAGNIATATDFGVLLW